MTTNIIDLAGLLFLAMSVFLLYVQIRKNLEWNRRKASQDMLFEMVNGKPSEIRRCLAVEFGVDLTSGNQDYGALYDSLADPERSRFSAMVRELFNYFETICVGMKTRVIEEDICYEHAGLLFTCYAQWGKIYIDETSARYPGNLTYFQRYTAQWAERVESTGKAENV